MFCEIRLRPTLLELQAKHITEMKMKIKAWLRRLEGACRSKRTAQQNAKFNSSPNYDVALGNTGVDER